MVDCTKQQEIYQESQRRDVATGNAGWPSQTQTQTQRCGALRHCQWKLFCFPWKVTRALSAHAVSSLPGRSHVSWKASPVARWALFAPGSSACSACFSRGLSGRFVSIYLDMLGMCFGFCALGLFRMSDIRSSSGGWLASSVSGGVSQGASRLSSGLAFGRSPGELALPLSTGGGGGLLSALPPSGMGGSSARGSSEMSGRSK